MQNILIQTWPQSPDFFFDFFVFLGLGSEELCGSPPLRFLGPLPFPLPLFAFLPGPCLLEGVSAVGLVGFRSVLGKGWSWSVEGI